MHVFSNAQPDVEERQRQHRSKHLVRKDLTSAMVFTVATYLIWVLGVKAVANGHFENIPLVEGNTLIWGLATFSGLLAAVSWDVYRLSRKALNTHK